MKINPIVDKYERRAKKVSKLFSKYKKYLGHKPIKHHSKDSFSTKSQEFKFQSVKPKKIIQPSTNNKRKQRLLRIKRQQEFHR